VFLRARGGKEPPGPPRRNGRFVYDGDASDSASLAATGSGVVEDVVLDYFASQSLPVEPTAFDGRSDYNAFISVAIPAGGLSPARRASRPRRRPRSTAVALGWRLAPSTTGPATRSTTCRVVGHQRDPERGPGGRPDSLVLCSSGRGGARRPSGRAQVAIHGGVVGRDGSGPEAARISVRRAQVRA
jgi:hypothetical protein